MKINISKRTNNRSFNKSKKLQSSVYKVPKYVNYFHQNFENHRSSAPTYQKRQWNILRNTSTVHHTTRKICYNTKNRVFFLIKPVATIWDHASDLCYCTSHLLFCSRRIFRPVIFLQVFGGYLLKISSYNKWSCTQICDTVQETVYSYVSTFDKIYLQ